MHLYNQPFTPADFQVNQTKEEFEGDYTVVLFSLLKKTAENPASLGEKLGNELLASNQQWLFKPRSITRFLAGLTRKRICQRKLWQATS